jgi:hypothetical protein
VRARGRVWVGVVLGEYARAIVYGEDEDGLDAEEGERARHGGEDGRKGHRVGERVWCGVQ